MGRKGGGVHPLPCLATDAIRFIAAAVRVRMAHPVVSEFFMSESYDVIVDVFLVAFTTAAHLYCACIERTHPSDVRAVREPSRGAVHDVGGGRVCGHVLVQRRTAGLPHAGKQRVPAELDLEC